MSERHTYRSYAESLTFGSHITDRPKRPIRQSLLSINQVAQRLGVNARHVRRFVFERRIPYVKTPVALRSDAIDRFVEEHTHEPDQSCSRTTIG